MSRILVISFAMVVPALPALAQDDGPRCESVVRNGRAEMVCDIIDIEADVPRPFVILPGRSAFEYEAPPLERELAREIGRTVRRTPF
jgi:hypothetical protein